jgi:ABC-type uncharacterized transport system substrate-binding protein
MKLKLILFFCIVIFFISCDKKDNNTSINDLDSPLNKYISDKKTGLKHKIFVVQSYENNHVCGKPQEIGFIKSFADNDVKADWKFYYMNTKLKNITHQQKLKESKKVLKLIENYSPDVVLVIDDNAIKYVGLELLDKNFYVIFSGMNGQPEKYNKTACFLDEKGNPIKNFTGIYEFLHLVKSFEIIKNLFPELKKVIAVIDTTPTGNAINSQFELETENQKFPFEIIKKRVTTFDEYKNIIQDINKIDEKIVVYNAALGLKTGNEYNYGAKENFKYYIEHSKIPSIPINYSFCKLGLFGGVAVNFEAMGYQAEEKAIQLLRGVSISKVKIENAKEYMLVFNKARANQLGIEIPREVEMVADVIYEKIFVLDN